MMYNNKTLNVVIPMAGAGSRFSQAGYTLPKPFITFLEKTMIEHVVSSLELDAQYTFIVQEDHIKNFNAVEILKKISPTCNIVSIDGITEGAACSLLYAENYIDNQNPLFIVNSDNIIEWNSTETMRSFEDKDGGIILTEAEGPKWSYARLDSNGYATEIAEKIQISTHATTGHYYWSKGADFVACAKEMISRNIRFNNEFYIAPVYNIAIEKGMKIYTKHALKFWSVGTPEDLNYYLESN